MLTFFWFLSEPRNVCGVPYWLERCSPPTATARLIRVVQLRVALVQRQVHRTFRPKFQKYVKSKWNCAGSLRWIENSAGRSPACAAPACTSPWRHPVSCSAQRLANRLDQRVVVRGERIANTRLRDALQHGATYVVALKPHMFNCPSVLEISSGGTIVAREASPERRFIVHPDGHAAARGSSVSLCESNIPGLDPSVYTQAPFSL